MIDVRYLRTQAQGQATPHHVITIMDAVQVWNALTSSSMLPEESLIRPHLHEYVNMIREHSL